MIVDDRPVFSPQEMTIMPSQLREPVPGEDNVFRVKTVKEFDVEEQPRERALALGIGALTLHELFALILRTGQRGLPVTELCRRLLKENGKSLHMLERRERAELMQYPGIGLTKAIQIEAVMELIRRYCREQALDMPAGSDPDSLAKIMNTHIGNLDHEEIWAMFLNRANKVMRLQRLTSGGAYASVFDVKALMKKAVLDQVSALVLCHNHPSGTLRPSPEDDRITQICKRACETLDIRFLDHLIITSHGYFSYHDEGRL